MTTHRRLLARVLSGTCDASIRFDELCGLLRHFGFGERIRGDHHIFARPDVAEILNLQPRHGQAKPYQVKQVRQLILQYKLGGDPDAE